MAAPAITSDGHKGGRTRIITVSQSGANNGNVNFEIVKPLVSLTAQLGGTYAAGTVALQGSNDGSTFAALPTAVSFTGLGIKSVAVADLGYRHYRAAYSSMDAGNTLDLTIVAKHFF